MRTLPAFASAIAIAVATIVSAPSQAATAYQHWAQGRGAYVPSKERGWTYEDDLRSLGWDVPPPPPGRHLPPPPPPPGYWDDDGPGY